MGEPSARDRAIALAPEKMLRHHAEAFVDALIACPGVLRALADTTPAPDVAELPVSRELLASFVDSDPCWFDHHGGCQAHGYLSLEPGELCPQAELKALLDRNPSTPGARS